MFDPAVYFRFYGPFAIDPTMYGNTSLLPAENFYPGNLPATGRLVLYKSIGDKRFDFNKTAYNFRQIETRVNNLMDENFLEYAEIASSKFKGTDGTALVTQDEITVQPRADLTNVARNRIPRIDDRGFFPMPNSSAAQTGFGRITNAAGSEYISVEKDDGVFVFFADSAIRAWITAAGWVTIDPGTTTAPSTGFAWDFDPDKTIWIFFKDNDKVAFVDGNNQTANFVNTEPGDDATEKTTKAEVVLNSTDNRIEFFTQTESETALKRTGFIDSSGLNNG